MSTEETDHRVVQLTLDGTVIPVSRHVLVENSEYFEAIFQPAHSGFLEKDSNTLDLKDFDFKILTDLLEYLKNSCQETEASDLVSKMSPAMFCVCVRLMMKFDYEKIAIKSVTVENCYDYLVAAESTASKRLRIAARHRMLVSFSYFRTTLAFKRLTKEDLICYLSSRHLTFNHTKEILEAIIWWLKYDLKKRKFVYKELLHLVEWSKLNKEQFQHIKTLKTVRNCSTFLDTICFLQKLKNGLLSDALTNDETQLVDCFEKLRKQPPLILLVQSYLNQMPQKKTPRYIAFYNTETQSFIKDYYILVEDFPVGCCVAFHEGNLIIFGGIFGMTTSNWNYDIVSYNIFTKEWKIIGRLNRPRRHFELVQNGNKFYLLGGFTTFRIPTKSVDIFDFTTGTIEKCADMIFQMNHPFACCWSGEYLYVFDGSNSASPIYSYDPKIDDWKVHLPAFKVIYGKLCVAIPCGKYVYLTGYDCPVLLRKYVRQLRNERIDTSKTWINDCELISGDVNIYSIFKHNDDLYLFHDIDRRREFALEVFNTKTTNKSRLELPGFLKKIHGFFQELKLDISCEKLLPTEAKAINAAWLET